ncbi:MULTISPECIES: methyltransferase domain-containing protein [unclassified Streptomyces]|uniref:methyltransferase domain-containing protein n=1 Tax=unclassified Streptomyces TaxID=2593676 RepID=UPI00099FFDCE|nr:MULTISPECIES: methyltransferase domain-containing protein [unclassified Streptomyces]MCP3765863.1 methyltransferase domain-containing protein [Streptomyces sp. MAR25Y5]
MSEPDAPTTVPSPVVPSPAVPRAPVVPAQQASARVHEPRRGDCPWCGSTRLRNRLRTGDLRRHRPGRFTVDACRECGHTFQNPRLTAEGLAFHRRTARGAPRDTVTDHVLALRDAPRRRRATARAMLRFGEPESWLDVGTGHGRFPDTAREFFPYTAFDGTDLTARVERARVLGRVEEAHIGALTDPKLLARVAARYDVVSLLHHLEHTTDPRAELRAALDALRPGGHLLIETLNPDSAFAALFGSRWLSYDQPRRLHLLPPRNLRAELEALGCTIVTTRSTARSGTPRSGHRSLYVPYDLAGAAALTLSQALPAPDAPWRAIPPTPFQQQTRAVLLRAGAPLVAVAALTDLALAPVLRLTPFANAYRIIARKPPH